MGNQSGATLSVVVGSASVALNTICVAYVHHVPHPRSASRTFYATADAVVNIITGLTLISDGAFELTSDRYNSSCSRFLFLLWMLLAALSSAMLNVGPALDAYRAVRSEAAALASSSTRSNFSPKKETSSNTLPRRRWAYARHFSGENITSSERVETSFNTSGIITVFPFHRKSQPQTLMFPPVCFTLGMVFFLSLAVSLSLQTRVGQRNDWSSDYRENFVIGLVQGLVSGNLTHEQLAKLSHPTSSIPNKSYNNAYQMNGSTTQHTSVESQREDGQHISSGLKEQKAIKNLLLKMGIANEAIENIFSSTANTLGANFSLNHEQNNHVGTPTRAPNVRLNIRTEIPAIEDNPPQHEGVLVPPSTALVNTSLLYQMIQRLNNSTSSQGSQEEPHFIDLRPNDATESTLQDFESSTITENNSKNSEEVEMTTEGPIHENKPIQDTQATAGETADEQPETTSVPVNEEESTTIWSDTNSAPNSKPQKINDDQVNVCYLKTNFSRGFATAVFVVMFCAPVLATLALNGHSLELLLSSQKTTAPSAASDDHPGPGPLREQAWADSDGRTGAHCYPKRIFPVSPSATVFQQKMQGVIVRDLCLAVTYVVFWLPLLVERLVYTWRDWKCLPAAPHSADFLFILALSHAMFRAIYYIMDDLKQRATVFTAEPPPPQDVRLTRHSPIQETASPVTTRRADSSKPKHIQPLNLVLPL